VARRGPRRGRYSKADAATHREPFVVVASTSAPDLLGRLRAHAPNEPSLISFVSLLLGAMIRAPAK
jgi:hypothetical protein